jgi:putative flippase GtrA
MRRHEAHQRVSRSGIADDDAHLTKQAATNKRQSPQRLRKSVLFEPLGSPTRFCKFLYIALFDDSEVGIPSRMLRYLIAGGSLTLLYMALVTIQVEILEIAPVIATSIAFLLMEILYYLINRLWVYKSSLGHLSSILRYFVVIVIGLSINSGIMAITVDVLRISYVWGLVATTLILPLTNFLMNFYWAFRREP